MRKGLARTPEESKKDPKKDPRALPPPAPRHRRKGRGFHRSMPEVPLRPCLLDHGDRGPVKTLV